MYLIETQKKNKKIPWYIKSLCDELPLCILFTSQTLGDPLYVQVVTPLCSVALVNC